MAVIGICTGRARSRTALKRDRRTIAKRKVRDLIGTDSIRDNEITLIAHREFRALEHGLSLFAGLGHGKLRVFNHQLAFNRRI